MRNHPSCCVSMHFYLISSGLSCTDPTADCSMSLPLQASVKLRVVVQALLWLRQLTYILTVSVALQ